LRDPGAAQDATQEVFIRLLRDSERLLDSERALPWIYQVATHHCLNLIRDAQQRDRKAPLLELSEHIGPDVFPERQLTRKVLERFDDTTCAIAVGTLVDGMEQQELALALGVSTKTVSRKLSRFLLNAKKIIERWST
jgi:RNA polymerase sigma-70 factor (ECF subfamily)